MKRLQLILLPALLLAGCQSPAHDAASAAAGEDRLAADALPPINAVCPIGKDKVYAPGKSVMFRGSKIGFCCEECIPEFEKLDDAGKIAALAAVGTTLPGK